jgi:predicted nucleic acid-binding protein
VITDVDTNVLLDVLIPDAPQQEASHAALAAAAAAGALIVSEPVYAELAAHFPDGAALTRFLADTGLRLVPSGPLALARAGEAWRQYRRRRPVQLTCPACGAQQAVRCTQCGRPIMARQHIVADFMVGAHALAHADQLLTRDRGYYTTYFPSLRLAR